MSWQTKKLGEICEENKKSPYKVEDADNSGNFPFFTSGSTILKHNQYLVDGENIFLSTGGYAHAKYYNGKACYSTDTWSLMIKNPNLLSKYLYYWILSIIKFIDEVLFRGSGLRHLQKREFWNLQIPIPSLPEQQKIVYILDCVQAAVGVQNELIEKTKELKKAMMAKLFREGTRGEKLKKTEIGEIPESWEVKKLVDIATLQRGKDLPEYKQKAGKYPIIGSSGIMGYHNEYYCIGPGIVTGRSGSIGGVTYTEENYWPHNTGLYVKDFHKNNPKFIYYLFHRIDFKNYATGVSVPTLNRNFVHEKKLPLPLLPEQDEIAQILQIIDQKIEIERKKKTLYEELFRTMLNKLMNQEIKLDNLKYA